MKLKHISYSQRFSYMGHVYRLVSEMTAWKKLGTMSLLVRSEDGIHVWMDWETEVEVL